MSHAESSALMEVRAERPVAGGAMLAHNDGCVVLVSGAIPGELVRVRVEARHRDVIHATVTEVLEADADRLDSPEDPQCGGQIYRHIRYERQLGLKSQIVQDAFHRIGRFREVGAVPVVGSPERGYRLRARLHVRRSGLGFLRAGTHETCDVRQTGQLLPETEQVATTVGERLGRSRSVQASVSYVGISENIAADERVVHFVLKRRVEYRRLADVAQVPGVSGVTARPGRGGLDRIEGVPTVSDSVAVLAGVDTEAVLRRRAASFFQSNRYLVPELVATVCRRVPAGPVLDLYAGVGLFSVSLAARGAMAVTAVERDSVTVADLASNAQPFDSCLRVVGSPVETYLSRRTSPIEGTVVVDPPRAGLARGLVERLVALDARTVVYVSCDPATLARDLRRFCDAGYDTSDVQAFDQFPNTAHIELVATLNRRRPSTSVEALRIPSGSTPE